MWCLKPSNPDTVFVLPSVFFLTSATFPAVLPCQTPTLTPFSLLCLHSAPPSSYSCKQPPGIPWRTAYSCAVLCPSAYTQPCQTLTLTRNTPSAHPTTPTPTTFSAVVLLSRSSPLSHTCKHYSCLCLSD